MGVSVFKTKLENISKQESIRFDVKYRRFFDVDHAKSDIAKDYVRIGDILKVFPCKKIKKGELENNIEMIDISAVDDNTATLEEVVCNVDSIGSDKNILTNGDILISKIVMSKGYIWVNGKSGNELIGSSEIIPYILRDEMVDLDFLKYMLILPQMLKIYTYLETGKTPSQKRVNPKELLQIRIPKVPYCIQNKIGDKIRTTQEKNSYLRSQVLNFSGVIDDVFSEELHMQHKSMKLTKMYIKKNFLIGKDFDLRLSYKYNNSFFDDQIVDDYQIIPFREFLAEPMKMGKSISPDLYDEEGEAKYIAMSSIKNWCINYEESKAVTEQYYEENKRKSCIQINDILMARSGEGTIGKVALVEKNEEALCADFIIRIRLKEDVNKKFMYYYMRSFLFQLYVEREKKGLGNNTNIFPKQINRIPVVCMSPKQQHRIVSILSLKEEEICAAILNLDNNKLKIENEIVNSYRGD